MTLYLSDIPAWAWFIAVLYSVGAINVFIKLPPEDMEMSLLGRIVNAVFWFPVFLVTGR